MRSLSVKATVVALMLSVAACGNGDNPPNPPTSTASTSSASPSTTISGTPSSVTPTAEGADAAPGAAAYYDSSQAARSKFASWWAYEVQTDQDAAVPADKAYSAGVSVCLSRYRGAGTAAIETVLERDLGFTKSGAAGIYKSALEALCTQYNLGYMTYFDKNVQTMIAAVTAPSRVTYRQMPPAYHFGYFMKEACAALTKFGGPQLWNHMVGMSSKLDLMEQGKISEPTLRIYLKAAVSSGCTGLSTQLPPVIQMAY